MFEHVGQHACLDLRNVDGLLLLIDAGLHAIVADPMAGAGAHRVVHHHDRQGTESVALLPHGVHLGNLLVERAARQRDAERVARHRAGLVANALRARVLVTFVAQDAVVNLAENLACGVAWVSQFETLAATEPLVGTKRCLG